MGSVGDALLLFGGLGRGRFEAEGKPGVLLSPRGTRRGGRDFVAVGVLALWFPADGLDLYVSYAAGTAARSGSSPYEHAVYLETWARLAPPASPVACVLPFAYPPSWLPFAMALSLPPWSVALACWKLVSAAVPRRYRPPDGPRAVRRRARRMRPSRRLVLRAHALADDFGADHRAVVAVHRLPARAFGRMPGARSHRRVRPGTRARGHEAAVGGALRPLSARARRARGAGTRGGGHTRRSRGSACTRRACVSMRTSMPPRAGRATTRRRRNRRRYREPARAHHEPGRRRRDGDRHARGCGARRCARVRTRYQRRPPRARRGPAGRAVGGATRLSLQRLRPSRADSALRLGPRARHAENARPCDPGALPRAHRAARGAARRLREVAAGLVPYEAYYVGETTFRSWVLVLLLPLALMAWRARAHPAGAPPFAVNGSATAAFVLRLSRNSQKPNPENSP